MKRRYLTIMLTIVVAGVTALFSVAGFSRGIVVVVNPENPIEALTEHEVKRIFLGRLRRFPDSDNMMEVMDQNQNSSIYDTFYTELIGFSLNKLRRYRAAYLFSGKGVLPTELDSQQAVIQAVSSQLDAVGYIEMDAVDESMKVVFRWQESGEVSP